MVDLEYSIVDWQPMNHRDTIQMMNWRGFLRPNKPKIVVFILILLLSLSLFVFDLCMQPPGVVGGCSVFESFKYTSWNEFLNIIRAILYWPTYIFYNILYEVSLYGLALANTPPDPTPQIITSFLIALPVLLIYWYLLACIAVALFSKIKRREAWWLHTSLVLLGSIKRNTLPYHIYYSRSWGFLDDKR